jgi:signal peptidase II
VTNTRILIAILLSVLADQFTKAAVLSALSPGNPFAVLPGVNLTLGFNTGASFGLFGGMMADRPLLIAALTCAVTVAFAVLAFRARHRLERMGLALIIGGALGNIIDRLRQGKVTDFLDLYWRDWHWPAFNVADIAITLGAACILLSALPSRRRREADLDRS